MRWPCVLAVVGLTGCGDGGTSGPFDGMPLDGVFSVAVSAPVHVARDRYGVAHIAAQTLADAAFVQGYVTAHDRLRQMDVLRRYGAGTLAELFGVQDPQVIDGDLEMRLYRMTSFAQATWDALQASGDPIDVQVVQLLAQYAAGVNRYAEDLDRGLWTLDQAVAAQFDPSRFTAWSPIDSLVIARFWALSQSATAPYELDATELYSGLRAAFDDAPPANAAAAARRGISRDLLRFAPVGNAPTIAGFPNVAVDTGSRSDGSVPAALPAAPPAGAAVARPAVPAQLFADARSLFGTLRGGPFGSPGAHAWLPPYTSGDAWALGAPVTAASSALLAADWQLPLTQPAAFYPTHLIVTGPPSSDDNQPAPADLIDAIGATIPGVPGVMFGANGEFAWAGTAARHDATDLYLEQIAPCSAATGDCVTWTDAQGTVREEAIEQRTETLQIGALGAIASSLAATYEVVPHHGPILPAIDRTQHALVPRTGGAALAIRSTSDQPSFELRALYNLAHATSVAAGFRATADITYGSQSWMMIDRDGHIGWTSHGDIPRRPTEAYAWNPDTHQDRLAPFFVLPGDGSAEWLDQAMSPRFIPHAIDPATGVLVAGNADPVGATADGLPLDQTTSDGEPLYVGVSYAAGLRDQRIAQLIGQRAAAGATGPGGPERMITLDDVLAIQRDTRSLAGEQLTPPILAALGRLDRQSIGPTDVNPYLDALSADDTARLVTARRLLGAWTFATPAAVDAADDDSAATAVFHAWIHAFIERALQDELDVLDFDVWRLDDDRLVRIVYAMLTDPKSFVTSPSTQQPILCDNYVAAGSDDSCTKVILQSMVDAMTYLESPQAYGTADPSAWRWGQQHRLAIAPLDAAPPADPGTPRAGDNFSVSRSDPAWSDLAFAERSGGTALRMVAEAPGGGPITVKWALPGGTIDDPRSPHDHDLLQGFLSDSLVSAPFSTDEIVAAGEARWVFH